ncbi:MAG: ABC transporter permease [Clostridia bacterium]|nr:ABC transporter permease [Clostridia bacterium]
MAVSGLRHLRTGFWLGWQMDANWASPGWFFAYSIVRPLAMSSILVVMYLVVTGGRTHTEMFAAMYLGNAFYMYVGALGMGVSMAVIEEREWFQMLKYIYLGTSDLFWYILGRAGAKFVATSIAAAVVLAAGVLFLHVPLHAGTVDWGALVLALAAGVLLSLGMGLALAGVMLLAARHGGAWAEGLAGALYLFTGTVFPLDVLPDWARAFGLALPFTHWLEALRRAAYGHAFSARFSPTLAAVPDTTLWTVLLASAAATILAGVAVFRACERVARERGLIDQVTEH